MTQKYNGPPCLACGVAHRPVEPCRVDDLRKADAERRAHKGKQGKVVAGPKFKPQVKSLRSEAEREARDRKRNADK